MGVTDFDVVVVGELNADLILSCDSAPQFGQAEKMIDDANIVLGSSSAIFACGAARLGLRVAFIGIVGDDMLGRFVLEQLRARDVNCDGIVVDPTIKSGLSAILVRDSGDRAILTYSGSIGALRYDQINPALLARGRHLHLGSYFLLDALRPDVPRLFDAAHSYGLSVSIDTNFDPAERWNGGLSDTLARADILLPNATEALAISKLSTIDEALNSLCARTPTVAVKLGADGAICKRDSERACAAGFEMPVVDTVGAGDSFDSGFIYGMLKGWPLERALRMACACGSLSTRAAGGTAAQATLAEALALIG